MKLIEPFAGLGSYSLRALWCAAGRDRRLRSEPPVSRVGSKAGFVPNVFRAWGLQRAEWSAVWLNDLDPVCSMLYQVYASSALRDAVARRVWAMIPCPECNPAIIVAALEDGKRVKPEDLTGAEGCEECNGTGTQDARRLWERIRSEPVAWPQSFEQLADVTARALFMQSRSFQLKPVMIVGGAWSCKPQSLTYCPDHVPGTDLRIPLERAPLAKRVEVLPGGWSDHGMKPEIDERITGVNAGRIWDDSPRWTVAERIGELPGAWQEQGWKPEHENDGSGAWVPRDELGSRRAAIPESGRWLESGFAPQVSGNGVPIWQADRPQVGARRAGLPEGGSVSIRLTRQDAALCLPDGDASDCVVVLDPPYANTTGYAHDSSRADVLMLARAWKDAGALVILHEAAGLSAELGKGWIERPASPLRSRGSSFWTAGEEREWVTASRAPVWWPAQQQALFAAAV